MAFFTAIGAAIFGAGTFLAGIATAVLKLAVGIGMNLLAQSLAGKPKGPQFSINGTIQGGGDLPRSIIFGEYATAGSLVWANTWGKDGDTKNAYLTQVIAVSDLPVKGYGSPWVNGEKVTFGAVEENGTVINACTFKPIYAPPFQRSGFVVRRIRRADCPGGVRCAAGQFPPGGCGGGRRAAERPGWRR